MKEKRRAIRGIREKRNKRVNLPIVWEIVPLRPASRTSWD